MTSRLLQNPAAACVATAAAAAAAGCSTCPRMGGQPVSSAF